jgi:hypothetical protein
VLSDIYASTTDASVKKSVLQAFMVSGEKDRVLAAARSGERPRGAAAGCAAPGCHGRAPGALGDVPVRTDPDAKKAVLQSLGVAGDSDRLVEVARSDKDPEMRLAALRCSALRRSVQGPVIVEIYKADSDPRVKEAALSALFVSNSANALIDIARSEKDPELKKKAVSHTSHHGLQGSHAVPARDPEQVGRPEMRPLLAAVLASSVSHPSCRRRRRRASRTRASRRAPADPAAPVVKPSSRRAAGRSGSAGPFRATERSSSCCWSGDDDGGSSCRGLQPRGRASLRSPGPER